MKKPSQAESITMESPEGALRRVASSYDYAEKITKSRAKNFYYAFLFLPPLRRRSIFAVYAFSRRADDAVDSVEEKSVSPAEARAELARLRAMLGPSPPDDPLVPALLDTIHRFAIALQPFEELLLGMEMDLEVKAYRTFEELHRYCYRAASVIGLICVEIFGHEDCDAREPAVDLGLAMQLTNILRDVEEDLRRGRVYLPEEDMARFQYTRADLEKRIVDDRFRALMAFEVDRARGYFRSSERLFPRIVPESRYCPILLKRFYSRILDRIQAQGYDVFRKRPTLPLHEKLRIAGSLWMETRKQRKAARI